jgi:hypothetical protein
MQEQLSESPDDHGSPAADTVSGHCRELSLAGTIATICASQPVPRRAGFNR